MPVLSPIDEKKVASASVPSVDSQMVGQKGSEQVAGGSNSKKVAAVPEVANSKKVAEVAAVPKVAAKVAAVEKKVAEVAAVPAVVVEVSAPRVFNDSSKKRKHPEDSDDEPPNKKLKTKSMTQAGSGWVIDGSSKKRKHPHPSRKRLARPRPLTDTSNEQQRGGD